MDDNFTPVAFATLTTKNGTELWRLLDGISQFVWDATKTTKVHFKPYIGYEEPPNTHGHLIMAVANEDLEKWKRRNSKFKPWKSWRFKTLDFQEWESGHDTFGYVLEKHTPLLPPVSCPKSSRACRSGHCRHIDYTLRLIHGFKSA